MTAPAGSCRSSKIKGMPFSKMEAARVTIWCEHIRPDRRYVRAGYCASVHRAVAPSAISPR